MTNRFNSQFVFARANGYKGTIGDYEQVQYSAYCSMCERCDITPMSFEKWAVA